ncbi:nucleotidyl transferase AbiEii/AbiGii toxin family protein [Actinocatenispora sera]|uniref:nucleotidyl transferase AbiEii/AbiGii toxin family protein n=1 Tax=Actinocatenispora sera TaxID=390989 RepID=UPI0034014D0D
MADSSNLTDIQVTVAQIFFQLPESRGYVVAGGAALLASHLIDRATDDIGLFASTPVRSVTAAKKSLVAALEERGSAVQTGRESATFSRLLVSHLEAHTVVDIAIDSQPATPPTVTILGPTLEAEELAGRKLLALFGRAERRDFADVYQLAHRFGKDVLLAQAAQIDPGFDVGVLGQMMRMISRYSDDDIPLPSSDVAEARAFFADWAQQCSGD